MRVRREIAKFHTIALTQLKKPGVPARKLHVLYLLNPYPAPLIPFVDFIVETGRAAALNWQKKTARALGLFVDFLTANAESLEKCQHRPQPLALFAEGLVYGTIDMDGFDRSGLYWEPRGINASRRILSRVSEFGDWAANRFGTAPINPWRNATIAEQIAFWRNNDQRRPHQLLGYVNSAATIHARASKSRAVVIASSAPTFSLEPPKIFPREHISDLILRGFKIRGRENEPEIHSRLHLRDMLITILLHGGGLRESEPFHLYVADVGIDPRNPKSALVKLFHPVIGRAPADFIDVLTGKRIEGTREQYLREKWQWEPRNRIEGRFQAGWKDLLLSDTRNVCTFVYWFPQFWGEIFLTLFKVYVNQCRSRHCKHPFLFVSEKPGFANEPYTIDSFRQAHSRAVRRIDLIPLKENGTTPHGHRHAYGQNLTDTGNDPKLIQVALHHKAPESQDPYTAAPSLKVLKTLAKAEQILSEKQRELSVFDSLLANARQLAA